MSQELGRQKQLPDWIYDGMILGIQKGTNIVKEKIKKAKKHDLMVNGIWCQDWCGCRETGFGYQVMWNWIYDETLYPKLPEEIAKWKKDGIRFLGYINPFLAIEKSMYRYAAERGYCVKDKEGKDYLVTITTFPAAMIDFANPAAYTWYKQLIKDNMIAIGMSGWMADFGEYLPLDCVLYSGKDPELVHNNWPAIWARMNKEAIEERGKDEEIFFFTRAGFTDTIRHSPMMYTGVNIPYGSMASVMTDDQEERSTLSVARSFGSGVGASIALAFIGYETAGGVVEQSDKVIHGMYGIATLIPFVIYFAMFLILQFGYTLSKSKLEELKIELGEIRRH